MTVPILGTSCTVSWSFSDPLELKAERERCIAQVNSSAASQCLKKGREDVLGRDPVALNDLEKHLGR